VSPILNYTTTVAAAKTASEVQGILGKAGASTVLVRYEQGRAVGVVFELATPLGVGQYVLPVRVDAVRKVLYRDAPPRYRSAEQAERVAWRIAKDWLEAQVALVQAGAADMAEVMMPYLTTSSGQTMYELLREHGLKAIEP
jgi:hypothetical protein